MNYIYGIHDREGAHILQGKGYCVITELVGDGNGADYSSVPAVPIVRLNYGYFPNGTIPTPDRYDDFSDKVARYVEKSQGCHLWILGNEPNHSIERPNGIPILPTDYARLYALCRQKMSISDKLLIGAIAPWNAETTYPGNERGDWIQYLDDVLANIYDYGITPDGITVHTYTHGSNPFLILDESRMNTPFQDRYYNFRAYRDFLSVIPPSIPVYITETDQNDVWLDENNGWCQTAYNEINEWNKAHNGQIKCLTLYRWNYDKWRLKDKQNVLADFQMALDKNYTVQEDDNMTTIVDGFERGFVPYQGISELECPLDWIPVWIDDPTPGVLDRPEYKPAGAAQIRTGIGAAAIHSRFNTIDGCLVRSFNVALGNTVKASVWMLKVAPEGGHSMRVGIDPLGGNEINNARVVWSEWYSENSPDYKDNEWRLREVQTLAQANVITVFLRSKVDYAVDGTHAHFDDFEFQHSGDTPVPPTGGLMDYVNALQSDIDELQADLNALKLFIQDNSIRALPL